MIVVDTNVITYLFIEGEQTIKAQQVLALDAHWVVPLLWKHEFLNVLTTFARQGGASLKQVEKVWDRAVEFFSEKEQQVEFHRALSLSLRYHLSAYDAQYLSLAESLRVKCVTEDRQILKAYPKLAISMEDFCANTEKIDR